jgi:methyl-accepting chemotaxis protein
MQDIRQKVETSAKNILMLSERTQQIGEIIDTVNAIADQSKLALNASIEAAALARKAGASP